MNSSFLNSKKSSGPCYCRPVSHDFSVPWSQRHTFTIALIFIGMVLSPLVSVADQPTDAEQEQEFLLEVRPLFKKYCFDCHGNDQSEGNITLDMYESSQQVLQGQTTWLKVIQQLQVGTMPPEDADQPSDEQRKFLLGWIDKILNGIDCSREAHPGRVTIRRLNRFEYRNSIRDLLDVDYQPAADFPADNEGYGFDNIGDVLSLPPILMEKYLTAAEVITDQVTVALTSEFPQIMRQQGIEMEGGGKYSNGARILANQGEISTQVEIPADGLYELSLIAFGHQAGDEPVKMAIRFDDQDTDTFLVKTTEQRPQLFRVKHRTTAGKHKFAAVYLNDYYRPGGDRNLIVNRVEVHGPFDENPELDTLTHEKIPPEDVARLILARLASQAYRRPVTTEELDRLSQLVHLARKKEDDFQQSIQFALRAVLVSPHFLFRVEANPPESESVRMLNDYELASRLSYFLWSSMPDEELRSLAAQNALRDEGVLEGQVRRMLKDPKSNRLVKNFAGQWLNLRNLSRADPDPERFPEFDEPLRAAMLEETERFFSEIMSEDRSVLNFLDANFTYLNERLARHYGISDVQGKEFRRVELVSNERGGLLTHASILTITSNPTRTSPVKRGKWMMENILGTPVPPPPPEVETLEDDESSRLSRSLRNRMEQHRSKPVCASCHKLMDPLGFGFENFDAVGAWRDLDGEFPIDASGVLANGETFQNPRELRILLKEKNRKDFCRCLTEKMLTYAIGRGLEYYDKCVVDEMLKTLVANDYRFVSLVMSIVHSDPFQKQDSPPQ